MIRPLSESPLSRHDMFDFARACASHKPQCTELCLLNPGEPGLVGYLSGRDLRDSAEATSEPLPQLKGRRRSDRRRPLIRAGASGGGALGSGGVRLSTRACLRAPRRAPVYARGCPNRAES
jgi:hypothetical protein